MRPYIRLLELLEELSRLQDEKFDAGGRTEAYEVLEKFESKAVDALQEYKRVLKALLDAFPRGSENCPACTRDWDCHDSECPYYIARCIVNAE